MNSFYAASSENFFQDVKQGRFQQLMIENASRQNINVGEAEQRSYKASGQKIKELLKAGRIKDVYLVFELMVPYSGCRIDCMIFGCDSEDGKNVMHIELKQWYISCIQCRKFCGGVYRRKNTNSCASFATGERLSWISEGVCGGGKYG